FDGYLPDQPFAKPVTGRHGTLARIERIAGGTNQPIAVVLSHVQRADLGAEALGKKTQGALGKFLDAQLAAYRHAQLGLRAPQPALPLDVIPRVNYLPDKKGVAPDRKNTDPAVENSDKCRAAGWRIQMSKNRENRRQRRDVEHGIRP